MAAPGTCTFDDSGVATGTDTIHASTTFSILGHSTTRSTLTSGTDSNGDGLDVTNKWVDARIALSPASDTYEIGTPQQMTCTIKQDTGSGFVPAPDNTKCSYTITGANAATSFCLTSGGTGTCTFNDSGVATGTDTIHASTTLLDSRIQHDSEHPDQWH